MRFGGVPFVVEGFSEELKSYVLNESHVRLAVGVQRHMCFKCKSEGGVLVAMPETAHGSEVVPLVFVGGDACLEEAFVQMRESNAFARSPWPLADMRAAPPTNQSGPPIEVCCPSCHVFWGPNHLRQPALNMARQVRKGLAYDSFVLLQVIDLHGNPMRMLDDRVFCLSVVSRLQMETLSGAFVPDDIDRVFLPTLRGLETVKLDRMSSDQRTAFTDVLPEIMKERCAFGYAVVYLERGDGKNPVITNHVKYLEDNKPMRGVNGYVRGRGVYHVFSHYDPASFMRGDAGHYLVVSLENPPLDRLALAWPKRVMPFDRVVPSAVSSESCYLPMRDRPRSGVGVLAAPGEFESGPLVVHDAIRCLSQDGALGVPTNLLVLCEDESQRSRHVSLVREMLTLGSIDVDASCLDRIVFEVLPFARGFAPELVIPLLSHYTYCAVAPPLVADHLWWSDVGYRRRSILRLSKAAAASGCRVTVAVPTGTAAVKTKINGDPYWDVPDLSEMSWSTHCFVMSSQYAKRYGFAEDRRLRMLSSFYYAGDDPSKQQWFERSTSGRAVFRPVDDPSASLAETEVAKDANADVDDIFYRWRRKKFARFRAPKPARFLVDAVGDMRRLGINLPTDFVYFLSKTDGCDTQAGSRLRSLSEVKQTIDPASQRVVIGTSSLSEYYDILPDGEVEVMRRDTPFPIRIHGTFALFLANLEREQVLL